MRKWLSGSRIRVGNFSVFVAGWRAGNLPEPGNLLEILPKLRPVDRTLLRALAGAVAKLVAWNMLCHLCLCSTLRFSRREPDRF